MTFLNLVEIFQILSKYYDGTYVIDAQHDILHITSSVSPENVSEDDKARLKELKVHISEEGCFYIFT